MAYRNISALECICRARSNKWIYWSVNATQILHTIFLSWMAQEMLSMSSSFEQVKQNVFASFFFLSLRRFFLSTNRTTSIVSVVIGRIVIPTIHPFRWLNWHFKWFEVDSYDCTVRSLCSSERFINAFSFVFLSHHFSTAFFVLLSMQHQDSDSYEMCCDMCCSGRVKG